MSRTHSAVKADNVHSKFGELLRKELGRSSKARIAIHLDRHLSDDRQVTEFADGLDRLFDDRKLRESFENEQIDTAVEQSLDEWEPWTGEAAAMPRVTLDSVRPLGVNIEQALAFLEG